MIMFPFISSIELQSLVSAGANSAKLQELLNVYYTTHCGSLAAERVIEALIN
jgi:hypothetical protein